MQRTEIDYSLLDFGNGKKLERVGKYILVRPHNNIHGKTHLSKDLWEAADAVFYEDDKKSGAGWQRRPLTESLWDINCLGLRIEVRLSTTKQIGFFPEQLREWLWIDNKISGVSGRMKVLNFFGYTGIATLVAARAGASVIHVDSSRSAVAWARLNQKKSGLEGASIRWVVEDAMRFVEREVVRGVQYDAIILDPPTFGRGPKGELWQLEHDLSRFLVLCKKLLRPEPNFVCLNYYSSAILPEKVFLQMKEILAFRNGNFVRESLGLSTADDRSVSLCELFKYEG